jgi:hypothetical protein
MEERIQQLEKLMEKQSLELPLKKTRLIINQF